MTLPVIESYTRNAAWETATATLPSGTVEGDLLVLLAASEYPSSTTDPFDYPADNEGEWKWIEQRNYGNVHIAAWWKFATGDESSQSVVASPAAHIAIDLLRISGHDPSQPIAWSWESQGGASGTNFTQSWWNTAVDDCLAISFFGHDGADMGLASTSSTGWTAVGGYNENPGGSGFGIATSWAQKDVATAGAVGSIYWQTQYNSDGKNWLGFVVLPATRDQLAAPGGEPVIASQSGPFRGSSSSLTITYPDDIEVGDLIVIELAGDAGSGSGVVNLPTGWTLAGEYRGNSVATEVIYRIADGTEGSSIALTGSASSMNMLGKCLRVVDFDPADPIDGTPSYATSSNDYISNSAYATGNDKTLCRAIGAVDGADAFGPFPYDQGSGWIMDAQGVISPKKPTAYGVTFGTGSYVEADSGESPPNFGLQFSGNNDGCTSMVYGINGDPDWIPPGPWDEAKAIIEIATATQADSGDAEWDSSDWDGSDVWSGSELVWTDITDDYIEATVNAAKRQRHRTRYGSASASVMLRNLDGDYSPGASSPVLAIGTPLRIHVELAGNLYPRFRGHITDVADVDVPGQMPRTKVTCGSLFDTLARSSRVPLSSPIAANQYSGARVERILDSQNVPDELRDVDAGTHRLQASTFGGSPLDELYIVADSEGAEMYVDASGVLVFRDADTLSDAYDAAPSLTVAGFEQPTSGDGSDETWIAWDAMTPVYTMRDIANTVTIQRVGGFKQTRVDALSRQLYGIAPVTRSDLINVSDTFPAELAQRIIESRSLPYERVTSVKLSRGSSVAAATVLSLTQGDTIRIRRIAGASDEIVVDAYVAGWTDTLRPGRRTETERFDIWKCSLGIDQRLPAIEV